MHRYARSRSMSRGQSMKRLIFLNRFFYPDHSATSQILSDLAFHLGARGADVHTITSQQLYDSPRTSLPKYEAVNGVHVHRVATTGFGRSALWGRSLDYASYYGAMWRRARSLVGQGDVLIAKTDPPLASVFAMWIAERANACLVNWLQVSILKLPPSLACRSCAAPSVGTSVAFAIIHCNGRRPTSPSAISWQNGYDHARFHRIVCMSSPIGAMMSAFAQSRIVRIRCDESGDWSAVSSSAMREISAARTNFIPCLRPRSGCAAIRGSFLFIGGGRGFDQLAQAVRERGLHRIVRFMAYQPEERLKNALNAADVHLISLRPELEGLIVPSKFYGIAAVGRPMISVTASGGEIAQLVRQHECGLVIEPGDGQALLEAVTLLCDDPSRAAEMGRRARAMLDDRFARKHALARWESLLATLTNPAQAATCVSS